MNGRKITVMYTDEWAEYKSTNEHLINNTATFTGSGADPEKIRIEIKSRIYKTFGEQIENPRGVSKSGRDCYIRIDKNNKFAEYMLNQGYGKISRTKSNLYVFDCLDIIRSEYRIPSTIERGEIVTVIQTVLAEFGIKATRFYTSWEDIKL